MEIGAQVTVGGRPGMFVAQNKDGTCNIDFDDGDEADVPADTVQLAAHAASSATTAPGTQPNLTADEEKVQTLKALQDEEQRWAADHDAALQMTPPDFGKAAECHGKISALQGQIKRLTWADNQKERAAKREAEKEAHKQRQAEMKQQFEKEATAAITKAQAQVNKS